MGRGRRMTSSPQPLKSVALTLLLGLGSLSALGQERSKEAVFPSQLDLRLCAERALLHNPLLLQAEERVVEQQNRRTETRSAGLPRLDAVGSYSLEDQDRAGSFGGGSSQSDTSWNAGLEAATRLYAGGRLVAELNAQTAREDAFRAALGATVNRVLLNVVARYYAAVLALKNIAVQEEALSLFELQLALAQNRFEAGVGPRFDVLQAEVALANARPPLVRARNAYRVAIEELRQAVGLPYGPGQDAESLSLQSEWPERRSLDPVESAIAHAMELHPEIRARREERNAAAEETVAIRRARAPTVQGFANYLFQNDRFSEDDEVLQGWGVGIRASLPIWDGAAIRSRIGQASARQRQTAFQLDETELAI